MSAKGPDSTGGKVHLYDLIMSEGDQLEDPAIIQELKNIKHRYKDDGKFIAQGGMKTLEENYDFLFERKVAKAFLKKKGRHEDVERFVNEARIMAEIEHPNIVPVYDLGIESDGEPYFVMKLLSGQNLQSFILEHNASLKGIHRLRIYEIFLKICDGVSYAHSKEILHLDLKPENIQIDDFGEVLICDWGLAKNIHEIVSDDIKTESENSLKVRGTLGYMAPEVLSRKYGQESYQTDIYALGCLLYFMFTGQAAVNEEDTHVAVQKILSGDFQHRKELNEACPSAVNEVILKAMSFEQSNRYTTVDELSKDLRAYLEGYATEAENAGFLTLIFLLVKRYKLLTSILLLTIVLSVVFTVNLQEEKQQKEQALVKALASEQKALSSLKALETEKATGESFRHEVSPKVLRLAHQFTYDFNFEMALLSYEQAYRMNPKNSHAILFYAYALIGELNLTKGLEILKKYPDQASVLWLHEKVLGLGEKPSIREIEQFIDDLTTLAPAKHKRLRQHLVNTVCNNYPLQGRIDFARSFYTYRGRYLEKFQLKLIGETYTLNFGSHKAYADLYYLENLPITELDISHSHVTDLRPLSSMPLKKLNIANTMVANVVSLSDLPIEELDLTGSLVRNISPLRSLPLKVLRLGKVKTNIHHLAECKQLEKVYLPKGVYSDANLKSAGILDKLIYTESF